MKQILSILCVAILALTVVTPAYSQAPDPNQPKTAAAPMVEVMPKKPYDDLPAKYALEQESDADRAVQNLNLQMNLQLKETAKPFQDKYAQAEKDLNAWVEQMRKNNGWGPEVIYNRFTRKFEKPAPAAVAPATQPTPSAATPAAPAVKPAEPVKK